MNNPVGMSRRRFLARCGVLGAMGAAMQLPAVARAGLVTVPSSMNQSAANDALRMVALDTLSGLVAFVVPGPDAFSMAQGVTHATAGGVDPRSRAPEGMVELFDRFLPWPDTIVRSVASGLAEAISEAAGPAVDTMAQGAAQHTRTVDDALRTVLANDETVPLSLVVALMLNFTATSVRPDAIVGPFSAAPFANLTFAEKAEVFRRMEEDNVELIGVLDRSAPEPFRSTLSGHIELMGSLLPGVAYLYSATEYGVFDPATRKVSARPFGWDLANYAPGRATPPDGWDEFKGYYRGRRSAVRGVGPTSGGGAGA